MISWHTLKMVSVSIVPKNPQLGSTMYSKCVEMSFIVVTGIIDIGFKVSMLLLIHQLCV